MKKLFTLVFLSALATGSFAQLGRLIDFETGVDTGWTAFANGTNTFLEVVQNPFAEGVNTSDSVFAMIVRETSDRWCGAYSDNPDYFIDMTGENHTLVMMVYKPVISPTRLKVERSINDGEDLTILAENSLIEEWELLTYDFSAAAGYYYERLTFFPDFPEADPGRSWSDSITVYIDNIGVPDSINTSVKEFESGGTMQLYPVPAEYRMAVSYPGMTAITISDVMGRRIETLTFPPRDSKVVETGHLKTGIYFVTADTPKGKVTMRFYKQ